MPITISYCPYRLLFKHPFGTAHGVRTGTDSIFIRLEENGVFGYGEVTLPPYLKEKPDAVIDRLHRVGSREIGNSDALKLLLEDQTLFGPDAQGCRAGVQMALSDLIGNQIQLPVNQIIDVNPDKSGATLVTVGLSGLDELSCKIEELPGSDALKLKVGHEGSLDTIQRIRQLDGRPLFLDANQGLSTIQEALLLVEAAGDRLLAMEQPFPVKRNDLQKQLQERLGVVIYGDESIQDLNELENSVGVFKGLNIKLMKCGGLDRAKALMDRAAVLGMKVMLGSMSESSLGCTAMAHMAGKADIVDLDGPWLIKNDPFQGISMDHGKLIMPHGPGIGAVLRTELEFKSICA